MLRNAQTFFPAILLVIATSAFGCLFVVDLDIEGKAELDGCDMLDGSAPADAQACSAEEPCRQTAELCLCGSCVAAF